MKTRKRKIKWLTDEEAKKANQEKDSLLRALRGRINYSFKRTKVYSGKLSPGCLTCGRGKWSCMYINGLCTANCFFCPQDRNMKKERPPQAERIVFDSPDDYADYIDKSGFTGVGFSGGECMLVFEKLVSYVEKIRQRSGRKIYIWIYTNGGFVNADRLKTLKKAGLDEIRFNICARNYNIEPVKSAVKVIETVTVEIPAIPEDYGAVKKSIFKMQKIGVDYLNIHQLYATKNNFKNLLKRNYTLLPFSGKDIRIFESEITALKLLRHALDKDIKLPINYCSGAYKEKFQGISVKKKPMPLPHV